MSEPRTAAGRLREYLLDSGQMSATILLDNALAEAAAPAGPACPDPLAHEHEPWEEKWDADKNRSPAGLDVEPLLDALDALPGKHVPEYTDGAMIGRRKAKQVIIRAAARLRQGTESAALPAEVEYEQINGVTYERTPDGRLRLPQRGKR